MWKRLLVLFLASALVVWFGCDTQESLMQPDPVQPSFDLMDATRELGNPHFFWLPPMVPEPSCEGIFDDSLEPVVTICKSDGSCFEPFTMTTGPGSETIRVVPEDEHYIVNWNTDDFDLTSGGTYRIEVTVAGTRLGYADVVIGSGGEPRNLDTDGSIPLKDGRTLPVKFRIEEGAAGTAVQIDGVLSPGEWEDAEAIPVREYGEYAGTTVYAMNDESNVYFAIKVPEPTPASGDRFIVRFDNANNDILDLNEDEICAANPAATPPYDYIDCYTYQSSETISWGGVDPQQDGSSAMTSDGTWKVFEVSRPLSSGDPYDFSLTYGGIVGFCAAYFTGSTYVDYPQWCIYAGSDLSGYAKLEVISP